MNNVLQNIIKGLAHASAVGSIGIGTGLVNVTNMDMPTILYLVITATLYNALREIIKSYAKE